MIAAVGRPFARNASINEEPRQMSAKPRTPPVPTTAQVAHQHKLRRLPSAYIQYQPGKRSWSAH
jgi:hypothetical protein